MMLDFASIYSKVSHLSKREKIIFYGAVIFVSLMILDRGIIGPISARITFLNNQIEEKRSTLKQNAYILGKKDVILKEASEYASFYNSSFESAEEETASLLKEVENIANEASVYLLDIKPTGSRAQKGPRKYSVSLNCEAQMEQMLKFMYNVENSKQLLTIDDYQITPKSKDSSIATCKMTISKTTIPQ